MLFYLVTPNLINSLIYSLNFFISNKVLYAFWTFWTMFPTHFLSFFFLFIIHHEDLIGIYGSPRLSKSNLYYNQITIILRHLQKFSININKKIIFFNNNWKFCSFAYAIDKYEKLSHLLHLLELILLHINFFNLMVNVHNE